MVGRRDEGRRHCLQYRHRRGHRRPCVRRTRRQIIIGVEPALKLAAERFPGGRILVMGTEVTLREQKFATLMELLHADHTDRQGPLPRPR